MARHVNNSEKLMPMCMDVKQADKILKICIVYSRTPLPMRRADQMTVAHLIEFLHKRGHIIDLHYIDTGANADAADRSWLTERCREVHAYKHTFGTISLGLAKVLLRFIPVQVALFTNYKQIKGVRRAVKENGYDVVYTYYFRSAEVTKNVGMPRIKDNEAEDKTKKPVSCLALQLSQTLNSSRISNNAPNLLLKIFYKIESKLVERYETRIWKEFTKSILIGKSDVEVIQKSCKRLDREEINNYFFGAHGTDLTRFAPKSDIAAKENLLVFSGVMRTPTNVQAIQWFVSHVWPLIYSKMPEVTLSIVGREPTTEVIELGKLPGIEVTGTVPDPSSYIAQAAVCINPMQAGGGMQNKLIEYLASGKPVVATSVANEGIGAKNGFELLIADSPDEFAKAVLRILKDKDFALTLSKNARAYALNEWTWEAHFYKLEKNFYSAIEEHIKPNIRI